MRFLFIMDPAEAMLPLKDTSFAFMRAARERGHQCFHCLPQHLFQLGRSVSAFARPISVQDAAPYVELGPRDAQPANGFDAIFIRKDPPFDTAYLHLTQQLDLVEGQTLVINSPQGLRDANEKLFAFHFAEFMPRSLVSADPAQLLDFIRDAELAVLKPLDGAGGSGVVRTSGADNNARALVDLMTREGKEMIIAQEFQQQVSVGDKRVLVLDGKPLGAILRVPRADDFRANIHVGGRVEATQLSTVERALVDELADKLRQRGLWFVGLDLIGGKLIEVNVTSPTGIQELGRLTNTRPDHEVVLWVESRVQGARRT